MATGLIRGKTIAEEAREKLASPVATPKAAGKTGLIKGKTIWEEEQERLERLIKAFSPKEKVTETQTPTAPSSDKSPAPAGAPSLQKRAGVPANIGGFVGGGVPDAPPLTPIDRAGGLSPLIPPLTPNNRAGGLSPDGAKGITAGVPNGKNAAVPTKTQAAPAPYDPASDLTRFGRDTTKDIAASANKSQPGSQSQPKIQAMPTELKESLEKQEKEWAASPFAGMAKIDIALLVGNGKANIGSYSPEMQRKLRDIYESEQENGKKYMSMSANSGSGNDAANALMGGLGSGLTFGAQEFVANKLGDEGAKYRAKQIELAKLRSPVASTVGNIAGGVMSMQAVSGAVSTAFNAMPWFSKLSPIVKNTIIMSQSQGLRGLLSSAAKGGSAGEIAKEYGISSVTGALGSIASAGMGWLADKGIDSWAELALKWRGMAPGSPDYARDFYVIKNGVIPNLLKAGLRGATYTEASTYGRMMLDPKYRPRPADLAADLLTSFIWSSMQAYPAALKNNREAQTYAENAFKRASNQGSQWFSEEDYADADVKRFREMFKDAKTAKEANEIWKRLSKEYHPDKADTSDTAKQKEMTDLQRKLNGAYGEASARFASQGAKGFSDVVTANAPPQTATPGSAEPPPSDRRGPGGWLTGKTDDTASTAPPPQAQPARQINSEADELKQALDEMRSEATAAPTERRPDVKPQSTGKPVTVHTSDGTPYNLRYLLVPADSLVTSHFANGETNPGYPQELQPRDRERQASQKQIQNIARNLVPQMLGESNGITDGAPIIGRDGVVDSGNGRIIALKEALKNPEKSTEYHQYLKDNAQLFGINPDAIKDDSILVRARIGDTDAAYTDMQSRAEFARKANESNVLSYSASETAVNDAKKLSPDVLSLFSADSDGDLLSEENRDFIKRFINEIVPSAEQGRYVSASGGLTQEGLARIRNAIFQKAYGDTALLAKLSENLDDETKNLTRALLNIAPKIVRLNAQIDEGTAYPSNISGDIAEAAKLYDSLKSRGMTVDSYDSQMSLVDKASDEVTEIARNIEANKRSAKAIIEYLGGLVDGTEAKGDPRQVSMFGEDDFPEKTLDNAPEKGYNDVGDGVPDAPPANESPAPAGAPSLQKRAGVPTDVGESTEPPFPKGVSRSDGGLSPAQAIAGFVESRLADNGKVTALSLFREAGNAYGGTMANGDLTSKDAYDAMELGVNQHILKMPEVSLESIEGLLDLLPTQTKRTEGMEAFQQFSTPPPIAYLANYAANVTDGDTMLEPSAGIGGIAVFAKRDGAKVYVNELDPRRLELLKNLPFDGFYNEDAEQLDNILGDKLRPSVIVMNPPFSSSGTRNVHDTKIGATHIEQALKVLAPNGRLVAIVGQGMADGAPAFRKWWDTIKANYDVKANIGIDGKNYSKYGTNFGIQLLVIDKTGPQSSIAVNGSYADLAQVKTILEDIRNGRPGLSGGTQQSDRKEIQGKNPGNERGTPAPTREKPDTATRQAREPAPERAVSDAGGAVDPRTVGGGTGNPVAAGGTGPEPANGDAAKSGSAGRGGRDREPPQKTDSGGTDRGDAGQPGLSGIRVGGGVPDAPPTDETTAPPANESPAPAGAPSLQKRAEVPANAGESTEPPFPKGVARSAGGLSPEGQPKPQQKKKELTDSIFEAYHPQSLAIKGAKPHPANISESAAMNAVEPPPLKYSPKIGQDIIDKGILSDVQLEAISYAGQSHAQKLPDGRTRGFFLGDGTGVGKGRTISGIILDSFNHGAKKALWVSMNESLANDAKRDISALFGDASLVNSFEGGKKADKVLGKDSAILFVTYGKLANSYADKDSNFDKIVNWLGKDFDGIIAFDEAHKMGNAEASRTERGAKKATKTGLSGVELQKVLPDAKIVYSSATGATNVENLRYAERLGLWGEGTPFTNGTEFVSKIKAGGIAAMELVARDLKAMGVYVSRNISYDDVKYDRLTHKLTKEQKEVYDELARAWQITLQNVNKALKATNQAKDGQRKGNVLGAFWGSQQRFFNQIITSAKMPSLIADIQKQLDDGNSVVVQLTNTNEAQLKKEMEQMITNGQDIDDIDLTPKALLMKYIENGFPVEQYEAYVDENGNEKSRRVLDSKGEPVLNREMVKEREALLDKLGSIKAADNPLDQLIAHFGADNVAESTGRKTRIVVKDGKKVTETRSDSARDADIQAFQDGKKRILAFSEAGGTGKSYHADNTAKNQQHRMHYLLQAGWKADTAVQGFGRTHRTNQASAPTLVLVSTDLKGESRFISTIAKRLDQLGALTKGQRQTGSQGLFSSGDNLEGSLAGDVLAAFYRALLSNRIEGINGLDIIRKIGLEKKLTDEYGNFNNTSEDARKVNLFLNRILTLESGEQNAVFEAFSTLLQLATEKAMAEGSLDRGLENYKADRVELNEARDIREDELTGAKTKYYSLTAYHKIKPVRFTDVNASASNFEGYFQNRNTGNVRAAFKTNTVTDQYGKISDNYRLVGPAKVEYIPQNRFYNWDKITADKAEPIWNEEVANLPEHSKENLHLISGAVLPVWDKLPTENVRIYRVLTSGGDMLIGRVIPDNMIDETLRQLGAGREKKEMTPGELLSAIKSGDTAYLKNNWRIAQRKVSGENRIEIVGPAFMHGDLLAKKGVFTERIQYNTRYFVPAGDKAAEVLEDILKISPVVRTENNAYSLNMGDAGDEIIDKEKYAAGLKEFSEAVLTPLGLNIETFYADKDINGYIDRETGTIYVNGNSDSHPLSIVGHELYHMLSPEDRSRLAMFFRSQAKTDTPEFKAYKAKLMGKYQKLYDEKGLGEFTERDFWEELAAGNAETLFTNKDFVDTLAGKSKSLLQKILDFIRNLLKKIFGRPQYSNSTATEAAGVTAKTLAQAERMYADALKVKSWDISPEAANGITQVSAAELALDDVGFGFSIAVPQQFSSEKTSIKQVPALFKNNNVKFGKVNVDIGGGKYDLASDYLRSIGVKNLVFDPYNRSEEVNKETFDYIGSGHRADTVTCANVLNVIREDNARDNVVLEAAKAVKKDGAAYFMVYEGDGSGVGKQTSAGWQNNRPTADYVDEIGKYFQDVKRNGKLITAKNPIDNDKLPQASWELSPGRAVMYSLDIDEAEGELTPERKKEILEQYDRDRVGVKKPSMGQVWGERLEWVANNVSRTFPDIPERGEQGTFFAEFRKNMIQWKALPKTSQFMTQDALNKMTQGLDKKDFKIFSELVYFLDLQEEAKIQEERGYGEILLPNGIDPQEVNALVKEIKAEASPSVMAALEKRKNIWNGLKDKYVELNQSIGFKTSGKFDREEYYRHEVISHMNDAKKSGDGKRNIEINAGRGWLKQRRGSTEAINTDFLAVEYKSMLQMQYDAYIAETLGKIKERYDIKPELEKQAFDNNKTKLDEMIMDEAVKNGTDGAPAVITKNGKVEPDSAIYRRQKQYNRQIMGGFNNLFELAQANKLNDLDGTFSGVVEAIKAEDVSAPGVYRYLGALAQLEVDKSAEDYSLAQSIISARTVLKYTSQKRAWVKSVLGKDYQTWETVADGMGDTHGVFQPRRGNYFYTKEAVDEDAFNKAFTDIVGSLVQGEIGTGAEAEGGVDVKELFAQYSDTVRLLGAAYEQWVLPNEIITTMNKVANPKQANAMVKLYKELNTAWKGWATSLNPLRTVKFGLRNFVGDLDAVIAGRPGIVKFAPKAMGEIFAAMKNRKYSPEFLEWAGRGGYSQMIFANEMDSELRDKVFKKLEDRKGKGVLDVPANIFKGFFEGIEAAHNFREAILRYSAYLYFKDSLHKSGGTVKDYVASNRYIVRGLESVEDKAYQLSKDLLGAYDEVSMMGQTLRQYIIPFYSFTETNFRRYARMLENAFAYEGNAGAKAYKVISRSFRAVLLMGLIAAWNALLMRKQDGKLPPSVRERPHITLGEIGDDVFAFTNIGSLSELLEWFGLEDLRWTADDLMAPIDKAWGMITPFVKMPVELASGLNFYPQLTKPRAIRDRAEHLFNSLGVDSIYRLAAGKPTKGLGDIAQGAVVYKYDYKQSAYWEVMDRKREYQGNTSNTIYGVDDKSNALYYMKLAVRYGDEKAALKYLNQYFENGGTGRGIAQSFAALNPMYGFTGKETMEKGQQFVASLDDNEKKKLEIAQRYYDSDLALPAGLAQKLRGGLSDAEARNLLAGYIRATAKKAG